MPPLAALLCSRSRSLSPSLSRCSRAEERRRRRNRHGSSSRSSSRCHVLRSRSRSRANRTLAAAARRNHSLAVRAPAAVSYLRTLAAAQRTLAARLAVAVPAARVRWHYGVALDGVSVVLPASELARLRALPGATVWPTVTYHALRDTAAAGSADGRTPGRR